VSKLDQIKAIPPRAMFASPKVEARNSSVVAQVAAVLRPKLVSNIDPVLDKHEPLLDKPAGFDKRAYQREYMKRRRAEAKATK